MKNKLFIACFTVSTLFFLLQGALNAQTVNYKIAGQIVIGGGHRWDYLALEQSTNRLFVTHAKEVNVIDLKTKKVVGTIPNLDRIHGVAFAEKFGKGYISNGGNNTVTVFSLKTLKVLKSVPVTGKGPDAIVFDPYTNRVFTMNGHSSNVTAIDVRTDKVIGTVKLDGAPEFSVSDYHGKMFVNLEKDNAIDEFDPKTLKVTKEWSIMPVEGPTGLAIDRKNEILFSGGRKKMMAISNGKTGKLITTLPIGAWVDACAFDKNNNLAFSSNGEGTLTIVKELSPEKFKVIDNVKTERGARTMAFDETSRNIYLSTMLPEKNNTKSFGILILKRSK